MKIRLGVLTLLISGLIFVSPCLAASFVSLSQPTKLPEVAFGDADGQSVRLEMFLGKVVLLDIWATWCAPCREEFPQLDRLQGRLAGSGLVIVPLSIDRAGPAPVNKFYAEMKIEHLQKYFDPKASIAQSLTLRGVPTTLLLDRQGREVARVEGMVDWDSPEVDALIKRILSEK
ncbi:MAG TPA: TlpA family protein disulfide reductase [Rhodospirillaceae bacterium]|nr:TlpA family protein disulfide reductase [Rhodospirillaceae bacterium]